MPPAGCTANERQTMDRLIGSRVLRLEDSALLTGKGLFVDDIPAPDALHVAFVRSPHAHAAIRAIDTTAARQLPGVRAVLTLDDLAQALMRRRMPLGFRSAKLPEDVTPFVLANGEVAFVGEAVALVVADTRYIAEDAAALVDVDYEVLPAVADCRSALAASSPRVRREAPSNVLTTFKVGYGDVDRAFKDAAFVFAEELWQHRGGAHPIEGRGLLVEYRPADETLSVSSSTQMPHELFQMCSELIDLDENRFRVATADVGGGFGAKYCVYPEEVAVVAAAKLLRCSLKWVEDRREHFISAIQERDQYWSIEIAVTGEARICGIRGRLVHDQGAYTLQDVNLAYNSATSLTGPYLVPAYALDVTVAQTNKVPVATVRGAGYPEACFAMERLMDRVARELRLDRAEVRARNLIPADKMPYEKPLKARSGASICYDSGDYPACHAEVLAAAGWQDFARRQSAARAAGRYIGIGVAHSIKGTGRGPFESGIVRIAPSGRISVFTGAVAMGQGLKTALAQICAEQLGIRPEQVTVIAGDTAASPLGLGGFGSRQLMTAGSSVLLASKAVAAKARKVAGELLEAAEEDLELADGAVRVVGASDIAIRLGELARVLRGSPGYAMPKGVDPGLEANFNYRTDALAYANACHVAEVEVDIDTGAVAILRYVAIQDSGMLVNPLIVDGQVHGGITHGIGNALFEWMGYDDTAQPVTTTFAEYLLPTATELPRFETRYKQSPSPLNPLGAKGVGEVSTVPVAAALVSAIEDALRPFAVKIDRTPVTPPYLFEIVSKVRHSG